MPNTDKEMWRSDVDGLKWRYDWMSGDWINIKRTSTFLNQHGNETELVWGCKNSTTLKNPHKNSIKRLKDFCLKTVI